MPSKLPPGPRGNPLTGVLPQFTQQRLQFILDAAQTYGDVVAFRLGPFRVVMLNHPDLVHQVLVGQAKTFEKHWLDRWVMGWTLGNGLLLSEGDFHKRQRKLAQPAFHTGRITSYAQAMVCYTEAMLDRWSAHPAEMPLQVDAEMADLTMTIVLKTLFDAEPGEHTQHIHDTMRAGQEVGTRLFNSARPLPKWLPLPIHMQARRIAQQLNDAIMPIIEERRASGEDRGDLLSMLMLAEDEDTGERMTNRQLRDEAVTLFAAGHETTSNTLTWAFSLLAQHPHVEAKLHDELDRVLAGRAPTLADLPNLPYTQLVLKETLRLRPAAWLLNDRTPTQPVTVGGYTVHPGTLVLIAPVVLHRDPRYYDDPETFLPERWENDFEKTLPRYAYMPFGGGARVCIGQSFAWMEAVLILATVATRYQLSLPDGVTPEPEGQITLTVKDGLPMHLRQRVPQQATVAG